MKIKCFAAIALGLMLVVTFSLPVQAKKADCNDLKKMSKNLDDIATVFNNASQLKEGDELDKILGELVDALFVIADEEADAVLQKNVQALSDSYEKMDSAKFSESLRKVISSFDALYRKDC